MSAEYENTRYLFNEKLFKKETFYTLYINIYDQNIC